MALAIAALALLGTAAAAVEEFHAYMMPALPDTARVNVGSDVDLTFEVDETARQFNGYEVKIQWDPRYLTFVSVQEGSLFTELCETRWVWSQQTDSTITYAHVLLCAGVSAEGPGILSTYRFHAHAEGVSPITIISDPNRTFFDAGYYVWPEHPTYPRQVILHDAVVRVLDPTSDVGEGATVPPRAGRLALAMSPNPVCGHADVRFRLTAPASVEVEILDVAGRRVWEWSTPAAPSGLTQVSWPARDRHGRRVPAGAYYCRVRSGGTTESVPFRVVQ